MLEVGGGLDLGQEPLGADDRGQLGAQHLDRHLAVVLEVLGEVDRGHAAGAQLPLDAVAVGEVARAPPLDQPGFTIYDPVFGDTCLLIQLTLDSAVAPGGAEREDFHSPGQRAPRRASGYQHGRVARRRGRARRRCGGRGRRLRATRTGKTRASAQRRSGAGRTRRRRPTREPRWAAASRCMLRRVARRGASGPPAVRNTRRRS